MIKKRVLLIEDEDKLRRILELVLDEGGFEVAAAENGKKGIDLWKQFKPDVVVSDIRMSPMDGFAVLEFGQIHFSNIPVIILTAFGTVETAVSAMKLGAFDFLTKPVDHGQLLELAEQALARNVNRTAGGDELIGSSLVMQKIKQDIQIFASTDSSVLITGESGTGKELVARAIHKASPRSSGPMVRINCAAIPKDLLESELFGHIKGAFTGATNDRQGAFSKADQGVIFLDEIGDLPLELQPKLLHAVEEKVITPVGSSKSRPVSLKILSATNLDLETMVEKKLFRSDLYFRLNTVGLTLPPLRNRTGDILILAEHFLDFFSNEFNQPRKRLSTESMDVLQHHSWPGNVRELKNVIERTVLIYQGNRIGPEELSLRQPAGKIDPGKDQPSDLNLIAQEQQLMLAALTQNRWNQSKAARKLGITRSALRYRLQKYGITPQVNYF